MSDFNINLKHHGQCKFVVKFIQLETFSNLFPFKIVEKCQLDNFV